MKHKIHFIALMLMALAIVSCNRQNGTGNEGSKTEEGSDVIVIDDATFKEKVWNYTESPMEFKYLGDKPCVIDFYADWCAPCKKVAPALEELAAEYGGKVYIYKINIDKEPELAGLFGVRNIPTFLVIPMKGKPSLTSGASSNHAENKTRFKQIIDTQLLK